LMAARGLAAPGVSGGPISDMRSRYTWVDPCGRVTLDLDAFDQPVQAEAAFSDPRRGSVANDCHYWSCSPSSGLLWPDSVTTVTYPGGAWSQLVERRVKNEERADLSTL